MSSLLASIELCLNSKPLCPLNDDPNDINFLTTSHLLTGRSLVALPDHTIIIESMHLEKRYKLLSQMRVDFWTRWHREYLQYMGQRTKWNNEQPSIKVGSMVIIKSENSPPSRWPIARVISVHPGKDNLVRVATVKTSSSTLVRPIVKLILLF